MSGRPGIIGVIPLALLTCISQVAAKQIFPKEPAPVVHDAVEYRAPHGNIGHVEAGDATTGTKLWEKKIYDQEVDPKLEVCNQLKVITAIKIGASRLPVDPPNILCSPYGGVEVIPRTVEVDGGFVVLSVPEP